MEASLGSAKLEHFTLEVLPRLLQKGERLAVQEPERDHQMSVDQIYCAKAHRSRGTGQPPGHLSPYLYAIRLGFQSVTKMDQWHRALEHLLGM